MQILSNSMDTYVMNRRYRAGYDKSSDTWELRIVRTQTSDGGSFECQLSSVPVISYLVQLHVVDVQVDILGDEELFVQTDSSLTLSCMIRNHPGGVLGVVWSHDGLVLLPSDHLAIPVPEYSYPVMTSTVVLRRVLLHHAGQYTCQYRGGVLDNIVLHVLVEDQDRTRQLHTSCAGRQDTLLQLSVILTTVNIYSSFL